MQRRFLVTLSLVGQLVFALWARAGSAQLGSFTYNDFPNGEGLQLNGKSTNVLTSDGMVVELTSAGVNQAGSVFTADTVDLADNAGFSTFFAFRRGESSNPGGITFTLQSASPSSLGPMGSGLGYGGITNSLAVAFETVANQRGKPPGL